MEYKSSYISSIATAADPVTAALIKTDIKQDLFEQALRYVDLGSETWQFTLEAKYLVIDQKSMGVITTCDTIENAVRMMKALTLRKTYLEIKSTLTTYKKP